MKKTFLQTSVLSVLLISSFGISGKLIYAQSKATDKTPPPKHSRKAGEAPTAESLVRDMRKAIALIAESAKGKISPKSKEARPFWSALKDSSKSLDLMEEGIKAKDAKMLEGLDGLGRSVTQLSASWGILRGTHQGLQVGRGVIALSEAYDTYLFHFGPAAARHRKGGKLSKEEIAELHKRKAELVELQESITALKAAAKAKSYQERLAVDLLNLVEELDKADTKTMRGYCKFIYQWDRLRNTIDGYGNIVEVWYPEFSKKWTTVESKAKTMNSYSSSSSWSYYEGWSYTAVAIASYGAYYEKTAAITSISESVVETSEEMVETYSEESATEESETEMTEINEEVEVDEEDDSTLAEEVEDGADDEDGDGINDEEDSDDDNDGTADDQDSDDDGDGVSDDQDEDEADDGADDDSQMDDDGDDDGVADEDDGGDDGGDSGDDGGEE